MIRRRVPNVEQVPFTHCWVQIRWTQYICALHAVLIFENTQRHIQVHGSGAHVVTLQLGHPFVIFKLVDLPPLLIFDPESVLLFFFARPEASECPAATSSLPLSVVVRDVGILYMDCVSLLLYGSQHFELFDHEDAASVPNVL